MSSTRQSITKDQFNPRENYEMNTDNNFNKNNKADPAPTIVGDDRSVIYSDRKTSNNSANTGNYSNPTSARNSSAAVPPPGSGAGNTHLGSGNTSGSDTTTSANYRNSTRHSQMNNEEAVDYAVQKAIEDEEKAKELDKKRTEVRSVIRNLYILFKYTNVGGLTLNLLKPIPKGSAQGERLRRTQIISQSVSSQITISNGNDGSGGGVGDDSDELSLANPPPLRKSWPASFFIIFLCLMELGLSAAYAWAYNHTSDHVGDVLYAITENDRTTFDDAALKIVMAAFVGAASNALYLAIGDFLVFDRFREALTYELLVRYMSDHTHFYLIHLSRDCDDPSGRLSSDIDSLCEKLKMIVFGTPMFTGYVTTTATVIWFTYTLVSEYGWFVMGGTMCFFVASVILTGLLSFFPMKKMKAQKEALSQFTTTQHYFAAHSEHVAFLRGESAELTQMLTNSKRVTITSRIATLVGLPLNFTTIMFYWGVTFFSALIPGFGYWWMHEDRLTGYDNLSNATYSVQALMNTMTTYILLAQEYSQLAAVLQRITELLMAMRYIEEEYIQKKVTTAGDDMTDGYGNNKPRAVEEGGYYRIRTVEKEPHASLEVKDVTLFRPNTHNTEPLIEHLSFTIGNRPGEGSLLIMGPSGVGKSSLLRVIAGLWPAMTTDPIHGGIYHPPVQRRGRGSGGMMFLPQRPYLIQDASLAAQIMYPMTANEVLTDIALGQYADDSGDSSVDGGHKNSNNDTNSSDRGPLMGGGGTTTNSTKRKRQRRAAAAGGAPPLAGLDEASIVDLKKEIFALLVKVRLGHVARRYSEADWFGIVKPECESDDEDEEIAFKANNKNRLSVMPATSFAGNTAMPLADASAAAGGAYGSTHRESFTSASAEQAANDDRLGGARMTVDMSACTVPWDSLLSVGEQQRLAIARVLFHRPHIAIVDEATSAMDEDSEVMCLQAIKDLNIKMLSVAHRSTVKAFHDRLLLITATGGAHDDIDNVELPPPLPLVNRSKPKISYEIVDISKEGAQ